MKLEFGKINCSLRILYKFGEIMKSKFAVLSLFLIFFYSNKINAEPKSLVGADIEYGEHLSGECVTCHNSSGLTNGIPKITGINTEVFIKAILAYKSKQRDNATMQMIASRLGKEEINSLALYFSKIK
jgi:cytochrome c553